VVGGGMVVLAEPQEEEETRLQPLGRAGRTAVHGLETVHEVEMMTTEGISGAKGAILPAGETEAGTDRTVDTRPTPPAIAEGADGEAEERPATANTEGPRVITRESFKTPTTTTTTSPRTPRRRTSGNTRRGNTPGFFRSASPWMRFWSTWKETCICSARLTFQPRFTNWGSLTEARAGDAPVWPRSSSTTRGSSTWSGVWTHLCPCSPVTT
jgi:hypothetical protein